MTSGFIFNKSSMLPLPISTAPDSTAIGMRDVVFFMRLRWHWIILLTLFFLGVAILYVGLARPVFVAETQLIVVPQVAGSEAQRASAEDAFIEAQLEIANSSDVLGAVATSLNLVDDPDFQNSAVSLQDVAKASLVSLFGDTPRGEPSNLNGFETRTEDQKKLDALIVQLRNVVAFRRIGRSTILQISASAYSPEKAAAIANAVAQQYIRKNVAMNAAAAQQYSTWLEGFMAEQRRGLTEAANALISYKNNPREQFKLAELQSAADARRTLFEATLTKLAEMKQRISYPVSDATIVSPATPPLSKARPRAGLIVAFAGTMGIAFGLMLALIRHAGDRRIISPRQLAKAPTVPFALSLEKSHRTHRNLSDTFEAAFRLPTTANFPSSPGMGELSTIASGLRRRQRSLIGIVAISAGSGATTIASELAILSALSGSNTLLIDAAQTAKLSKWISPDSGLGLADVIDANRLLPTALSNLSPTLKFLPRGKSAAVSPAVRLSSRRTNISLQDLKNSFDNVIIDLTAMSVSADATALGPELDGVLLVSCYGRTSIDEVTRAIESMHGVGAGILGVIVNKTPARWMS